MSNNERQKARRVSSRQGRTPEREKESERPGRGGRETGESGEKWKKRLRVSAIKRKEKQIRGESERRGGATRKKEGENNDATRERFVVCQRRRRWWRYRRSCRRPGKENGCSVLLGWPTGGRRDTEKWKRGATNLLKLRMDERSRGTRQREEKCWA